MTERHLLAFTLLAYAAIVTYVISSVAGVSW